MKIILTGSSSGIGRALAKRLLENGNYVWGIARSEQMDLERNFPSHFRWSRGDVSDWAALASISEIAASQWRSINAIIACAGVQGAIGPALKADPMKWSETIRANLDGTFYTIRAFAPLIAPAEIRGKIVCFSGGGATKARANFSAYSVAKTGVVRLVENLGEELKSKSIDINAIAPGAVNTRLTDEVLRLGPSVVGAEEFAAATKQKAAGGASMERALDLVEWLLSPDSDGISGRLLSAPWDPWPEGIRPNTEASPNSDAYMLRRITPEDRGQRPE